MGVSSKALRGAGKAASKVTPIPRMAKNAKKAAKQVKGDINPTTVKAGAAKTKWAMSKTGRNYVKASNKNFRMESKLRAKAAKRGK